MTPQELEELLVSCYSKDLCYPKVRKNWNSDNKYWGMCSITALIVDDFLVPNLGKSKQMASLFISILKTVK